MSPEPEHQPLSERQLQALLTLLGDEDPGVWRGVRAHLVAGGAAAMTWLEQHRLHADPATRRRVRDILRERDAGQTDVQFLSFLLTNRDSFDLEEATWMFCRTRHPDINITGYRALLDDYAAEVVDAIRAAEPGEQQIQILNQLLFERLGFRGNEAAYYEPENSYLNQVIDRRLGIPISLSVLYLFLARRLRLPVAGVGMPGHFLCRYQSAQDTHYIDPFHGGKILSAAECLARIQKLDVPFEDAHLAPATPRQILVRTITNVHLIHRERKQRAEADRLKRYLLILGR